MQPSPIEQNEKENASAPLLSEIHADPAELSSSTSPTYSKCSLKALFTWGGKVSQLQADQLRNHTMICFNLFLIFLSQGRLIYPDHKSPFVFAAHLLGLLIIAINLLDVFIALRRRAKTETTSTDSSTDSESKDGLKTLLAMPKAELGKLVWRGLLALLWLPLRPFARPSYTQAPLLGFLLFEAVLVALCGSWLPNSAAPNWFYPVVSILSTLYAFVALAVHSRLAASDLEHAEQNSEQNELTEKQMLDLQDTLTLLMTGLMLDSAMLAASKTWTQFAGGAVAEVCKSLCMIFGFKLIQHWRYVVMV